MAFPSHFHVPGAFHADGVHPGLFRPPVSPSSSTDYLSSSAFATEAAPKRKWSRSEVPRVHDTASSEGLFSGDAFVGSTPSSRPASRAYALAGQLDTPALDDGGGVLGESMFSDSDYRRALGSKRTRDQMDAVPGGPTMPLFNLPSKPAPALGWGSFAVATIGGVVGRVWKFCKTGAFKGFYPGDGTAFDMPEPNADETYYFQGNQSPSPISNAYDFGAQQNVPGRFPQGGQYYPDLADETACGSGASTPTGPAAKRRHTDHFNELGRNWVMIREPGGAAQKKKTTPRRTSASYRASSRSRNPGLSVVTTGRRMASPIRPSPRQSPCQSPRPSPRQSPRQSTPDLVNSTPRSPRSPRRPASRATNRPASRLSDAGSLRPPRPASAASFASFGGPKSPAPSKIPVKAASTASVASPASISTHAPPPRPPTRRRRSSVVPTPSEPQARLGHRRTNSAASAASGRGDASPRLNAEAKQLAARRKMEERDTDFRMAAFNKRLQDMIRQGKEALGTTIEIDVTESGWEDDN